MCRVVNERATLTSVWEKRVRLVGGVCAGVETCVVTSGGGG